MTDIMSNHANDLYLHMPKKTVFTDSQS